MLVGGGGPLSSNLLTVFQEKRETPVHCQEEKGCLEKCSAHLDSIKKWEPVEFCPSSFATVHPLWIF